MFLINISTSTMSIIIIFSLLTLRPHIDNFENRPKWLSVLLWHQHALVLCQTLLNCLLPPETCVSRILWPWILNFALRLLILSKIRPLSIVVILYCIEEAFWLERGIEHWRIPDCLVQRRHRKATQGICEAGVGTESKSVGRDGQPLIGRFMKSTPSDNTCSIASDKLIQVRFGHHSPKTHM